MGPVHGLYYMVGALLVFTMRGYADQLLCYQTHTFRWRIGDSKVPFKVSVETVMCYQDNLPGYAVQYIMCYVTNTYNIVCFAPGL